MKKVLLALTLIIGVAFSSSAQSLMVESYDEVVGMNSSAINDYSGHITLKNTSGTSLDIFCKRIIFGTSQCAFDSAYFCWDLCYGNETDESIGTVTIGAGQSNNNFSGHAYSPNTGVNCIDSIRYTFFDAKNAADSVSVIVKYQSSNVFSVDEEQLPVSDLYPNPASQFVTIELVNAPKPGTTIEVFNLLGSKVRSIVVKGKRIEIPVTDLHNGIYLVTLNVDGKAVETRKIVVRH